MSEGPSDLSSSHLEPPQKTTEIQDAGAGDRTVSESEDEHFSDASEGNPEPQALPPSGRISPVPRTRVERVDSSVQHGEVPGTTAFEQREQDAVPDEVEVVPDGAHSQKHSPRGSEDRSLNPEGLPIPRTVVEKIDPDELSHGEVPGTVANEKRLADAVPDIVTKAPDSEGSLTPPASDPTSQKTDVAEAGIPETRLERVETNPAEEEAPSHPRAHQSSPSDTLPDIVETVPDASSPNISDRPIQNVSLDENHEYDEQEGAEDFDEFVEEQDDMAGDDFGDFDDGFQDPSTEDTTQPSTNVAETLQQQHDAAPSVPPLTDFSTFNSTTELLNSLEDTLDSLFPSSTDLTSLPAVEPIPDSAAIFSTDRSFSLWSQLVAPPPLQPQNWVKSRIRRLFLVSLGVPVDLDEILPASRQKKLVLPSIDLEGTGAKSPMHSDSQVRTEDNSQLDPEKGQAPARQKATSRRGAPPPPGIDLSAVRRLCATTDAALSGLTDAELKLHVQELERVTQRASTVLEHWLKRRDGLIGEKEAFEGVIENLVSHVRRVRK